MAKLSTGTYNDLTFSIRICRSSTRPGSDRAFVAEVYVADAEGDIIDSFNEYGGNEWMLVNKCTKRIVTEEYS